MNATAGRADGILLALLLAGGAFALQPCDLHPDALRLLGVPGAPSGTVDGLTVALRAVVAASSGLGLGSHGSARLLAALATGIAAGVVHATARQLGLSRGRALGAALFASTVPAALLAATAVHTHALQLLLGSAVTGLAVAAGRRGGLLRALLLGGGLAGAACTSALGNALPLVAVAVLWFGGTAGAPASHRQRLLATAIALAFGLGVPMACRGTGWPADWPSPGAVAALDLDTLLPLFGRDAGRAYLPLSLTVLAALWSDAAHRGALVLVGLSVPFLLLSCLATATLGDEGAGLLPLLPLAALHTARWLPTRWLAATVVLGLGLGVAKVAVRAEWVPAAAAAHDLAQWRGSSQALLLVAPADEGWLGARAPEQPIVRVLAATADAAAATALVDDLTARLGRGERVLLTAAAETLLRDPGVRSRHAGAAALLDQLETRCRGSFVGGAGLHGQELSAR